MVCWDAQYEMAAIAVKGGARAELNLVDATIVLVGVTELSVAFEAFELLVEHKIDDTRDSIGTPGRRGAAIETDGNPAGNGGRISRECRLISAFWVVLRHRRGRVCQISAPAVSEAADPLWVKSSDARLAPIAVIPA